MKRDMDLIRKILFKIEDEVGTVVEYNLLIEGYSTEELAYHCSILYDSKMISDYGADYANNKINCFGVGRLTWNGYEFLDKIRSETVWNKTKETVTRGGLAMTVEVIKDVSTTIITAMSIAAIKRLGL